MVWLWLAVAAAGPQTAAAGPRLVATGPGYARLLYEGPNPARLGIADPDAVAPELLHAFVDAALVGIPLDGDVELEVLEAHVAGHTAGGALPEDLRLDGPAWLGEPGLLRHQRVVPVGFGPAATAGGAVVFDRVLVEVRFPDTAGNPAPPEDTFESSYRSTLSNYEQARRWRRTRRPRRRPVQSGVLPAAGMVRLVVRSDGIYRVTGAELEEAGVDLRQVDPARLRVLYGGGRTLGRALRVSAGVTLQPVPAVVEDGADGRFGADDHILFYGQAPGRWEYVNDRGYRWRSNLYTKDNVYWIDFEGAGAASRGAPRAPRRQVTADGQATAVVDRYRDRIHEEDERLILRQLVGINSGYDWYWEAFNGNARNFTIVVDDAVPGVPAAVRIRFFGWTNETHLFDLRWNDEPMGRFRFARSAPDTIAAVAEEGAREGLNQLGIFHRDPNQTRLDWFEVEFVRRLVARGGELVFDWPSAADGNAAADTNGAGTAEFRLSGFPAGGGAPRLFEVSGALEELVGFDYDATSGTVVFQDAYDGSGPPPKYVALQASRWKRPSGIVVDTQQRLRDPRNGAQYVVIAHADFLPAARRLAAWRGADDRFGPPMRALAVDVQDVYDEFSGGLVDPMAIRAFVAYAVENWSVPPVFVTLFGDGTYDYKNNSGMSHTNWIPPYQDGISMYDEWYVRIEGQDDLPDLAIGRLTVQSPEQAEAVVDKILQYDRAPEPGPWQTRVLLVADDVTNPQIPEHFEAYFLNDAEILSREGLPEDLDLIKLYIGAYPLEGRTKPKARDEFVRRFNEGALILTFLGHGNPEVFAHEQIFLVSRDVGSIDNGGRLPLIYTAASQVGVFDDPMRESMPETFLKMRGGAIGFISATRVGFHNSNMVLARRFHEQMYRSGRRHVPVGLALMEAKQMVKVSDQFRTNIQRYSLIGDPAQRLARPPLAVALELPDSLEALMEVEVGGTVVSQDGRPLTDYQGQALVRVFDSSAESQIEGLPYTQLGAPLFRGRVRVLDGRFQTRFRVPKDITYRAGEGRASVYVTGAAGAPPAFGSRAHLVLEGTAAGVEPDGEGPAIRLGFARHGGFVSGDFVSARPVLEAVLDDPSGINITGETGHEIELRLDDAVTAVTEFYTSQQDHRQGVVEVPLGPLEPGPHTIRLKAWDTFNNSSAQEAVFRVAETADVALSGVLFHPNPTPDGRGHFTYTLTAPAAEVRIQVFAVSGRQVAEVEGDANLGYNQVAWTGRRLANGTYLYRLEAWLDSGQRVHDEGWIQVAR